MTSFQKDIFALIKSALNCTLAKLDENFDWDAALKCGYANKIVPLLYYGAYNSGIAIPSGLDTEFQTATIKYLMHSEQQLYELRTLVEDFEKEKIDYVLLKGAVQKKLYPKPEMRPMGDIDIMIKQDSQGEKVAEIMKRHGFDSIRETNHELIWTKSTVMVELHKRLIPSYNEDYYKYFGDGWQLVEQADKSSTRYTFKPEDDFIYQFTHFAKHYRDAGIGVLHLVDLYVFLKNNKLNFKYLQTELKKLQLYTFFKNIAATLNACFEDGPSTELTDFILDRIFKCGSYGTTQNQAISTAVKKTKDVKNEKMVHSTYLLKRVFMPYKEMCRRNPILKKLPFLLPFFWIYRMVTVLFNKGTMKREINKLKLVDAKTVSDYYDEIKYVGLDFDFKD